MKTIHNLETGEIIERELNAEELAQQAIDEPKQLEKEAIKQARINARLSALSKLTALGLTEEEIATF